MIGTKNLWSDANPHRFFGRLFPATWSSPWMLCSFSAISSGNTTELQVRVHKNSVIRAVTALIPIHTDLFLQKNTASAKVQEHSQCQPRGTICTTWNKSWANHAGLRVYLQISEQATCDIRTYHLYWGHLCSVQVKEVEHIKIHPPHHVFLQTPPEEEEGTIMAKSTAVETTMEAPGYTRTASLSIPLPQHLETSNLKKLFH